MYIRETITEVDISRLAREISRDIQPLQLILEKAGVDSEQWDRIQQNPIFQTRLGEEAAMWAASSKQSIRERVATKAAAAIEELLAEAVDMVQDKEIPGAARVQALQFIAKMGQLGEAAMTRDDGSGRVQINIMLGGHKLSFEKEKIVAGYSDAIEGEVLTPGVSETP
jgi:hypothetical protein